MSEQFEKAFKLAKDSYAAGNQTDAISFCNTALMENPDSGDVKILRGASTLLVFRLIDLELTIKEALGVWESVKDTEISDEMKKLCIDAAFNFTKEWGERSSQTGNIPGVIPQGDAVQIAKFLERVGNLPFINSEPYFYERTLQKLREWSNFRTDKRTKQKIMDRDYSWFIKLCTEKANTSSEIKPLAEEAIQISNSINAGVAKQNGIVKKIFLGLGIIWATGLILLIILYISV